MALKGWSDFIVWQCSLRQRNYRMSSGKPSEGIIALAKEKSHKLEKLKFKSTTPLIMILDGIEKPGNIGALLRTSWLWMLGFCLWFSNYCN